MEKQPLAFLRAGFGRLSDSLLEFPLASSHVTLDKWPNPSASWSPPKLDERMQAKSQPTWPVTAPRQTLTPKAGPHEPCPWPHRVWNSVSWEAQPTFCPSCQSPVAPRMQPQESSIQYSRWEDSSRDEVSVASGPGAQEASGCKR